MTPVAARCGDLGLFFVVRWYNGIIPPMETEARAANTWRHKYVDFLAPAMPALIVLGLLCAHCLKLSIPCAAVSASAAGSTLAPLDSADIAASPAVTTPTASVAGFSVLPLPIVAAVVEICRLHYLACARMGGLHGP